MKKESKLQLQLKKRVREACKKEAGKSQIKRADMQTAIKNYAIDYAKNPQREHFFLMRLAKRHVSKVARNRKGK